MNYEVTKIVMAPYLTLGMLFTGDKQNKDHKTLRVTFKDENGVEQKTDIGYDKSDNTYRNFPDDHFTCPWPKLVNLSKMGDSQASLSIFRQIEKMVNEGKYTEVGV